MIVLSLSHNAARVQRSCSTLILFCFILFQSLCLLLGAICSVSCIELRRKPKDVNRIPNAVMCRTYCARKYMDCYQKHKCHKPEKKYRIQTCRQQYDECYTTCKKELDELDYDIGSKEKLKKNNVGPVIRRGRGRPPKRKD